MESKFENNGKQILAKVSRKMWYFNITCITKDSFSLKCALVLIAKFKITLILRILKYYKHLNALLAPIE